MKEIVCASEIFEEDIEGLFGDSPIAHLPWPTLDKAVGGVRRSKLTILAAESGVGKTSWANQLKTSLAKQGVHVIYASFEPETRDLTAKSLSSLTHGRLKVSEIPQALRSPQEGQEIAAAVNEYGAILDRIHYIKDEKLTVTGLQVALRHFMSGIGRQDIPVLIVDYLQKISFGKDGSYDEKAQAKTAVYGLRSIASEYGIPVYAISSISRTSYGKENVDLGFLAGSQAIEYNADFVLRLSVDGKGKERASNTAKPIRPTTLAIVKGRCDTWVSVKLDFYVGYATFVERNDSEVSE